MATRTIQKLSAITVQKKSKPGKYADGGGLYLQIGPTGNKAWLYRFMLAGTSREMGLGALNTVSLAEAREEANQCRKLVRSGVDPIEARRAGKLQGLIEASRVTSFRECSEKFIEAHKAGWKNAKHAAQWTSTLETYCMSVVGALPVSSIDTGHILQILELDNFWQDKTETASRLRGRIERILDWATVRAYRDGPNPARWRGHLDKTLPARTKVQQVTHHAALHYSELPAFYKVVDGDLAAGRALKFIILTVTRTNEALKAKWSEFDIPNKVWTIPAERMKAGREHKVPLTDAVLAILEVQHTNKLNDFVFAGAKAKMPLSNMTCLALLRRMERSDITVHGFRSTFRDWASEQTNFSREVSEMAMAHAIGDKVEAAYRRGDLLEKRRNLLAQWADYCGGKFTADVQPIAAARKRKAA